MAGSPFNPFAKDTPPPPFVAPVHKSHLFTVICTYALRMALVVAWAIWKRASIRVGHPYPRLEPPTAPVSSRHAPPSSPSLPPHQALIRTGLIGMHILLGPILIGCIFSFYLIAFNDDQFLSRFFSKVWYESAHQNNPEPFVTFTVLKYEVHFLLWHWGHVWAPTFCFGVWGVSRRWQLVFTPVFLLVGVSMSASKVIWLLPVGRIVVGVASGMASQVDPLIIKQFVPEAMREVFLLVNDIAQSLGMILAYGIAIYMEEHGVLHWRGLVRDSKIFCRISLIQIFQDIVNLEFLMLYIPLYFDAHNSHTNSAYKSIILTIVVPMATMIISNLIRTKRYDMGEMMVAILGLLIFWGFLHCVLDSLPTLASPGWDTEIVVAVLGALAFVGLVTRTFFENVTPEDVAVPFSIFKKGLSSLVSLVILFLFPPLGCHFKLGFLHGFAHFVVLLFIFILDGM